MFGVIEERRRVAEVGERKEQRKRREGEIRGFEDEGFGGFWIGRSEIG